MTASTFHSGMANMPMSYESQIIMVKSVYTSVIHIVFEEQVDLSLDKTHFVIWSASTVAPEKFAVN